MPEPRSWRMRLDPLPKHAAVQADLPFTQIGSGKVRELYAVDDGLLMIATDRLSAFDVIMNEGIPGKGIILTQMSRFWFERVEVAGIVRHHLLAEQDERLLALLGDPMLARRAMLAERVRPLPIEAVVRGYLAGSGWKAYCETGKLFDHELPPGLEDSARLPKPLFTPSTKAATGHDLPLWHAEARQAVGAACFDRVRDISLEIYRMGAERAAQAGMILADTKFEFGLDAEGELVLIDEVLTPDSSRYWPMKGYVPGRSQPSYDKQFVRDFLETCDWDKSPPPPKLPKRVIAGTLERYREAFIRLTVDSG